MSVTDEELRPPRETAILGLPIPGDVGPADYVSATGDLADVIDETVEPRVPIALPADLSAPPLNNPRDGQVVDLVVDTALSAIWRLRWREAITASEHKWCFLGGTPLEAYSSAYASPVSNAWVAVQPQIAVPRPGIYLVEVTAQMAFNIPIATAFRCHISIDRFGLPAGAVYAVGTAADGLVGGANNSAGAPGNSGAALVAKGRTGAIPVDTIRFTQFVNGPINQAGTQNRGMVVTPVRLA